MAVRAYLLLGVLIGAAFVLSSCAEALQTGRSTAIRPSPPLPSLPLATDSPTLESDTIIPQQEDPTASPAQEAQLPTTPITATALAVPNIDATPDTVEAIVTPTLTALSNEEKWRAQQVNREVFEASRSFTTTGSQLWWYDPLNQQHVVLGSFSGDFAAQARFELVGQRGVEVLEVPYKINDRYGLTSLSPALVQRMQAAGYADWVETYVFVTPNVTPR